MPKPPPSLCRRLFRAFIPDEDRASFFRGMDEIHAGLCQSRGQAFACFWYWMQLVKSLPSMLSTAWGGHIAMLNNFIKTTLRGIRRQKAYSAINILGLAVGLAVSILIFLWVRHEWRYDRFHVNADRIFRTIEFEDVGASIRNAISANSGGNNFSSICSRSNGSASTPTGS